MANKGLLVILSGPSGAGKGTVLKALLARDENIKLSVSATTRSPRPGETDGKEYYFISREKFTQMVDSGEMLENAEYCGNCYGTPAAPIEQWNTMGQDVILEIEVQGGAQVKQKRPDAVGIFILPPSLKVLEHRLRSRGTEADETVRKRLAAARREIQEAKHYDYVVVNDTVEGAAEQIREILNAEKCRTYRNEQLIERMLNND
ncbi:MAG TPA: guanylate kinase [Caproicibacter sp.]|nr:guanylate kinase [Caproicibacter sp.]